MFEAVVLVCLAGANAPCRDQLLPGYEAETAVNCEARLAENPPGLEEGQSAYCTPGGPILAVAEVAPGVFVHEGRIAEPDKDNRGDVANLGFIVGSSSVAVIDTGTARWMGEALWRAIRKATDEPVSHVILTHMHPDHVFGTSPFEEKGAIVVAHASLERDLADRSENYLESLARLVGAENFLGTKVPHMIEGVADEAEIDIGDRTLELKAWATAHTGTDLTVLDKVTGTLFVGDLVFHRHAPALDGSLIGWQEVLGELADLPANRVVPGHGDASLAWPDGADALQRYLSVLEADTRAAIRRGSRLGDAVENIAESEAALWDLFPEFNPRNATVAFTELEWE